MFVCFRVRTLRVQRFLSSHGSRRKGICSRFASDGSEASSKSRLARKLLPTALECTEVWESDRYVVRCLRYQWNSRGAWDWYAVVLHSRSVRFPWISRSMLAQKEHLDRGASPFVGVHVVETVPVARQVSIEPATPDDWELIQLHAGFLEEEFLRQVRTQRGVVIDLLGVLCVNPHFVFLQICVVNDKQDVPIWIQQNVVVHLRVSLPVGMYASFELLPLC